MRGRLTARVAPAAPCRVALALRAQAARGGSPSLRELSDMTAICTQDALETLQELGALK